ncbi:TPA: hypothetical protein JZF56_001007 [Escherichia coli]|uniref:hypothetical protein n=2 Tax=Escherichia coli TaxID=562 RepID=UPI0002611107|nr:hypothetical protein [Escherichia coli]EIL47272.1 hypothetical protein ECKD2_18796 [Escherichia coli KD2]ESD80449.1 hypothetical protein HMPREF1611_04128 [Escherichia coli 908573]EFF3038705.1 hypothetical protein [Escherichia coli]EFM1509389.1 hypothetical protein [Escherichia coli]
MTYTCQLSFGLSPLARGTLAAKTSELEIWPVYPRWRGEHYDIFTRPGKTTRFIPAGAGNTQRRWSDLLALPVYPRWRGEHRCCQ